MGISMAADSLCIDQQPTLNTMSACHYVDHDTAHGPAEPFEWEELPSLSTVVLRRHVPTGSHTLAAELAAEGRVRLRSEPAGTPVWLETAPAALDPLQPSGPLHDTELDGLAAREIVEPDVFKHFFGTTGR
jgi:hypothetical protein